MSTASLRLLGAGFRSRPHLPLGHHAPSRSLVWSRQRRPHIRQARAFPRLRRRTVASVGAHTVNVSGSIVLIHDLADVAYDVKSTDPHIAHVDGDLPHLVRFPVDCVTGAAAGAPSLSRIMASRLLQWLLCPVQSRVAGADRCSRLPPIGRVCNVAWVEFPKAASGNGEFHGPFRRPTRGMRQNRSCQPSRSTYKSLLLGIRKDLSILVAVRARSVSSQAILQC